MRRIAIVTNLHPNCGNYTFARDLKVQLDKYYEVELFEDCMAVPPGFSCCIINYHPARVALSQDRIANVAAQGAIPVVVYQNTPPSRDLGPDSWILAHAAVVVTHEPIGAENSCYIPVGILEVDDLPEFDRSQPITIGTAGFPFPWKGFDAVVGLAKNLGVKARIIAPPYPGHNFAFAQDAWRAMLGDDLTLVTDFIDEKEVARQLALNAFNVYAFESISPDDTLGQSGSARMGVAAQRPLILSKHPKLRTLREFEGSYYGYGAGEGSLLEVATRVLYYVEHRLPMRYPGEIVRSTGWSVTGRMYRDLIERLLG